MWRPARPCLAAILSTLLLAGSGAAQPGQQPVLSAMRAQLYYEGSGRLSEDLLAAKDFVPWNTIIGEGSAEENANDILISIQIRTRGETNVGPIRVLATGRRNRVVVRHTIDSVLTSPDGTAWKGIMLYDAGCENPLTVTATLGQSRIVRTLRLAYGE